MRAKRTLFVVLMSSGSLFCSSSGRETIFDRVVSIPQKLVLTIPNLPPLCDEIADLKKGFIEIKDGTLYYEQEGNKNGTPLVLINGGPGCTHQGFHPFFSRIKNSTNLIYYDQRGTGKSSSDATGKTYTIKQAVEDLECLRKTLKIEKWAMLGWSYGGLLAQCYALTYPEHVTGLILVAAESGLSDPTMGPVRDQMFISQAEQDALNKISALYNAAKLTLPQTAYNALLVGGWKRQSYYKPTREELIRKALYEWSPAQGFEALIRAEAKKINLENKFDDFEIPTLIIEAKWDLLWWNPDRAELMRKNHPHAQVKIFKKSGHKIFADEPKKFFSILRNFLIKSSKKHIAYKPGNRLTWPSPLQVQTIPTIKFFPELS
jgi:proline iminopeptidase